MIFISHSEQETKEIGKKIAAKLKGGEVLALRGDLGTGKTVLAKGIAEGLGYKKNVNSPTFVLMKVYKIKFPAKSARQFSGQAGRQISNPFGKLRTGFKFQKNIKYQKIISNKKIPPNPPLKKGGIVRNICHIDGYRVSTAKEIEAIGAMEYFKKSDTASIIEWPEKIKGILPKDTIWVDLNYGEKENERNINLKK